jgi:hypothetical protein
VSARITQAAIIGAATLGTVPVTLLTCAALARFLPCSEDTRYAIAFTTVIPLWVFTMCLAFLARSGLRAWACCAGLTFVVYLLVYQIPH